MPVKLKKLVTVIAVGFLVVASFVLAGQTANNSTPQPTGYTLQNIYELIENGNATETDHSFVPTASPQSSMYSTSEIYVALANLIDPTKLASTSVTYLGVTGGGSAPEPLASSTKEFSPTSNPGTVTGFTLQDIANLINNIRATTSAHISFSPTSGPADSGPTITEIYNSLSSLIQAGDIVVGTTYLGVIGTYEDPASRALYYKDTDNDDFAWDTLNNWWQEHLVGGVQTWDTPATSLPAGNETVYIGGQLDAGPGVPINLAGIYVASTTTGGGSFSVCLNGAAADTTFYDNSKNNYGCTINGKAYFYNGSENFGEIGGDAFFYDNTYNSSSVIGHATFSGNTINQGSVGNGADFSGSAYNFNGHITGASIFSDSSYNNALISGTAVFNNSAYNDTGGQVGSSVFNDSSFNYGLVSGNAVFNDNSYNFDNASEVSGDAVFNDNSYNLGLISGNADIYYPAPKPIGGTVVGSITYYGYPADYIVSGDIPPELLGNYFEAGIYDGYPMYRNEAETGFIWYLVGGGGGEYTWAISVSPGVDLPGIFLGHDETPVGSYLGVGGYGMQTAIVSQF